MCLHLQVWSAVRHCFSTARWVALAPPVRAGLFKGLSGSHETFAYTSAVSSLRMGVQASQNRIAREAPHPGLSRPKPGFCTTLARHFALLPSGLSRWKPGFCTTLARHFALLPIGLVPVEARFLHYPRTPLRTAPRSRACPGGSPVSALPSHATSHCSPIPGLSRWKPRFLHYPRMPLRTAPHRACPGGSPVSALPSHATSHCSPPGLPRWKPGLQTGDGRFVGKPAFLWGKPRGDDAFECAW